MDYCNPCPKCDYVGSVKVDKTKRQCYKCGNMFVVRIQEKAESVDPGKETSRQVAIIKNPILDAR